MFRFNIRAYRNGVSLPEFFVGANDLGAARDMALKILDSTNNQVSGIITDSNDIWDLVSGKQYA